jgi:hypothetical protein
MFGDADLDIFTADFGVSVTFTGAPAGLKGNLDVADLIGVEHEALAGVLATDRVVIVKTSAVSALRIGSAITVDGTNYTVRHRTKIDDGAFTLLFLKDV